MCTTLRGSDVEGRRPRFRMEHGRIVETGAHQALVAADGVYEGLWAAWQEGQAVSSATKTR